MIVGFNVDSLNADKKRSTGQGNLQVNYNSELLDVTSVEVNSFENEVAKIDFRFTVEYTVADETAAEINLEGNLLWNGDADEIVEHWEENNQLPGKVRKAVLNSLYRKSISQSVGIADTLGLIPPVPTPRINE